MGKSVSGRLSVALYWLSTFSVIMIHLAFNESDGSVCVIFSSVDPTTDINLNSIYSRLKICRAVCLSASMAAFNSSRPLNFCSRSEEHTSELQSRPHLVCRLLLEK